MHVFSSTTLTAHASGKAALAQLIDMDLAIPWRVNTSPWKITYLGEEYLGVAKVGSVDVVDDTPGELKGLKFSIPAIDPADVAAALAADIQGRSVVLYTAIFHVDTFEALETFVEWAGRLDVMRLVERESFDLIEVTAEHIGIDLLRPSGLMYTDEDQQSLYPGDKSFEYVVDQSTQQIIFPTAEYFKR
jgi:hypothetical protein